MTALYVNLSVFERGTADEKTATLNDAFGKPAAGQCPKLLGGSVCWAPGACPDCRCTHIPAEITRELVYTGAVAA